MKSKVSRIPEKRIPGLLISIVAFISIFLVAIWLLSSPSVVNSGYEAIEKSTAESSSEIEQQSFQEDVHVASREKEEVDDSPHDEKIPDPVPETEKTSELKESSENQDSSLSTDDVDSQDKKTEDELDQIGDSDSELDNTKEEIKAPIEETKVPVGTPSKEPAELSVENTEAPTSSLITQAKESKEEKINEVIQNEGTVDEKAITDEQSKQDPEEEQEERGSDVVDADKQNNSVQVADDGKYDWKVCAWTGAQDYIPCLDNKKAIKALKSTKHFEHRERHCPTGKDFPTCLVPLPEGYKHRIDWPESRASIWHANVPHDKLVTYKQDQNWVKKQGDLLVFPGGGTQFKLGATQYINSIHEIWSNITWGKNARVVLDVGCGVASFGGYMFDKDVLTMSFAPKDEHEAQVQMALERGIPGFLSVMGTKRLVFPSNVFDVIHCARCRVPWHAEGGKLLLELNRLLRPGGYFVWSATPVYRRNDPDEVGIWKATKAVTDGMCWKLFVRTKTDPITGVGVAIFQKPQNNDCYEERKIDEPPMCAPDDKPDAAWYVDMNSCLHRIPSGDGVRATEWPVDWPARIEATPHWLKSVPKGLYGKPAAEEFVTDSEHWRHVIENSYMKTLGINWGGIRNILEMKAGYGGFAAALASQPVWVMNVVPTDEPDTLPIIFDRGLFGVYHDWCESFSTYPRSYDLVHADHLFERLKKRCGLLNTMNELDRILRPDGWMILREKVDVMSEIEEIAKSMHWDIRYTYEQGPEKLLAAQKGFWRPDSLA